MQFSSIFLRHRSNSLPRSLIFLRSMGGGPRTFPGGLNKWQWKRMHEKKAREKEKRLLDQEKQVYQARVRSEIRTKIASAENSSIGSQNSNPKQANYGPVSPEEHIRALADRFMKEGAEDLWNEADGPSGVSANRTTKNRVIREQIDLRKMVSNSGEMNDKTGFLRNFDGNLSKTRGFCTYRRCSGDLMNFGEKNDTGETGFSANVHKPRRFVTYTKSSGDLGGYFGSGYLKEIRDRFCLVGSSGSRNLMSTSNILNFRRYYSVGSAIAPSKRMDLTTNGGSVRERGSNLKVGSDVTRKVKWFRSVDSDSSDEDESDDCDDGDVDSQMGGKSRIVGSSAALGKYDRKIKKRLPLNFVEDEVDLSQQVEAIRKEVIQRRESGGDKVEEESVFSSKRFDECDVSSLTVQALTEAGFVQMTRVQEATLDACLEGNDALVKARAGTGKSIAFLLPAIETVLKASTSRKVKRVPPIYVLILCPTRELASQICAEANVLLKHHEGIGVQMLVGGTRFKVDQRRIESESCQIIVATPGRLLDHIENKSGISVRLMGLEMLIIDEADRLLDLGFRKDMEKIVDCLPRKRQSLLFSATLPKEVRRVSQLVLKKDPAYIDTVGLGCVETPAKVKQFYHIAPHDQHFELIHHLLKSHTSQVLEYKVIVFCATSMMTSLMYTLFREMKLNVREIHSQKPAIYRDRIINEFKESKGLILITSDFSARGMDYPDVTLVVQVGIPSDRGQYIHRLGRTGRQGKEGEGFLFLAPWEQYFLDEIKDLPIEKFNFSPLDTDAKVKISNTMDKIDTSVKEAAYHSWLGYYNSINAIGRDKTTLVELANQFAASIGLQKPPSLFRKTALKMGLKDIAGIRIRK